MKSKLDIPTQSIVRADEPAEGSAAWMKQVAKDHGDTSPLKLEKRREKMSVFYQLMQRSLEGLRMQKKQATVRNKKIEEEALKKLRDTQEDSPDFARLGEYVGRVQLEKMSQEQQYDLLINQQIVNMTLVEGLCLIVDSVTLRETVKSKNKKVGMLRFSNALYACDATLYSVRTYNRLRKLTEMLAATNPLLAGSIDSGADDEEDGDEDGGYDDDDVVNEEDRKKIREEVEGVDL